MVRNVIVVTLALMLFGTVTWSQSLGERINSYASECEHEVVQRLLDQGADPDSREEDGMTPLLWAANSGCLETVRILLAAGADPNAVWDDGTTPLIEAVVGDSAAAIEEMHPIYAQIVELLLEAGADPSVEDPDGYTALEIAREVGYEHLVVLLEGAD